MLCYMLFVSFIGLLWKNITGVTIIFAVSMLCIIGCGSFPDMMWKFISITTIIGIFIWALGQIFV